jgi:hypothetical protein
LTKTVKGKIELNNSKFKKFDEKDFDTKFKAFDDDEPMTGIDAGAIDPHNLITPTKVKRD